MMTNEEKKLCSNFIHHRLQPLCAAIDGEIIAVTYGVCASQERVYIIFDGGYKEIDVSGMTLREMVLVVVDSVDDIQGGTEK